MVTGGHKTLWAGSVCCGYALEAELFAETTHSTDNSAAKQICENMGVTGRTKHFQDNLHYVRQLYDYGKIYIEHVRTHLQRADGFTKPLEKLLFLPWRSVLVE